MGELLSADLEILGIVKIEVGHPVLVMDELLSRLSEPCPYWDIFPSLEQYIEENDIVDFVRATSIGSAAVADPPPIFGSS